MPTSPKDATKAAKLLRKPKTPKNVKSVSGSDLAQAARKRPKKNAPLAKAAASKRPKKR